MPLSIEIDEQALTPPGDPRWQDYQPADLATAPLAGGPLPVRFTDGMAQPEPAAAGIVLPGGLPPAYAFRTAAGVLCLVERDRSEVWAFAASLEAGDAFTVSGRLVTLSAEARAVVVERMGPPPQWTVTARLGDREVARFSEPGDYPLDLPCAHRPGRRERVLLRLTDVRRVALTVQGHAVDAELADTPQMRSWGLQGRRGLGPDEGMLFYFPEAERPGFVMKTVSFPLSIAFIRGDGLIVHVARLNPGDRREARPPESVNYVLEMPQGWFAERGIGPGGMVCIPEQAPADPARAPLPDDRPR